jgi:hypothetical protein
MSAVPAELTRQDLLFIHACVRQSFILLGVPCFFLCSSDETVELWKSTL